MNPRLRVYATTCGRATLWAAAGALWPCVVLAQSGPTGGGPPMTDSVEVQIGLGVMGGPSYLGSDKRKTRVLPLLDVRWRNGWFAGVSGIGYRFDGASAWSAGPRISFDLGRNAGDSDALAGMGDISARPEIGGFVNYSLSPALGLGTSIRYGSGNDRHGMLADLSVRGMIALQGPNRLFLSGTATVANRAAMRSQFGVTAAQALTSGYPVHEPGAGLRDVSLSLAYGYAMSKEAMLRLVVTHRALLGDAKSSSLAKATSGSTAGLTLGYRF